MTMNEKIEIPLSKNKLFFGIAGSFIFVILGIFILIKSSNLDTSNTSFLANPILMIITGISSILFFGATGIFGVKKLLDKKFGLIIDSNGITDHSNASSIGLIKWQDISEISTRKVMSTKFLMVKVTNPEAYIEKATSGMKAKLMRTNMQMYGSPLSITSNTLAYDFDKLEKIIETEFKRYKTS